MPWEVDLASAKRHVAVNLSRLRKRTGWTQQQVADAAGLDLKHLQKVEYGELNLSLRTLVRLASGLGVQVTRLLRPVDGKPSKRAVGRPSHRKA